MSVIDMNAEQFRDAVQGETPVVVDFWAPWCTYCRRIGPAFDKIAGERQGLVFAKVNIDDEPALMEAEKIEVIPTLVVYCRGERLGSVTAPGSKSAVDQFIDETLAKAGRS